MQPIPRAYKDYIEAGLPGLSDGLVECLEGTAPSVAVRINRRKLGHAMPAVAAGGTPVAWCDGGYYLPERPDFTHDPALHQGLYYVQDASSMITSHVVGKLAGMAGGSAPLRFLDACAAPGGKTTAAIDALPDGSLVVANEYDYRRAEILKENVAKWGYPGVVVTRGDTARFRKLPEWFDIVAADVPCSGEGMMRKDETARTQWSEALVRECAARQREIVENLWVTLRPGGYLIYSTCTFNCEENERNVDWMTATLGAEPVPVEVPADSGIVAGDGGAMRFLPTRLSGEGLFMAVLRKPLHAGGNAYVSAVRSSKKRKDDRGRNTRGKSGAHDASANAAGWLKGDFRFDVKDDAVVYAMPACMHDAASELASVLDVICLGTEAGVLKGKSLAPAQGLALSAALSAGAFRSVEVDLDMALAYLRRESLAAVLPVKGFVLLTFCGTPLGFVNNLPPGRANNLYPAAWRILK